MFGLFGKQELENSTFNHALIVSLGESIRSRNRYPTEKELLEQILDLVGNKKITSSQINSIRACVVSCQMSFGDELRPLLNGLRVEIPQGGRSYYDKIIRLLATHIIITTDEALAFMQQHGWK